MDGVTITYLFPEDTGHEDRSKYCQEFLEKIKAVETIEERKWEAYIQIFEPNSKQQGVQVSNDKIGFVRDVSFPKATVIIDKLPKLNKDSKDEIIKGLIQTDENFPYLIQKTNFQRIVADLSIKVICLENLILKGFEIDYDDFIIKIGILSSKNKDIRIIMQNKITYRPIIFKKEGTNINIMDWFSELLSLFFDTETVEKVKKQKQFSKSSLSYSESAQEIENFKIGKYYTIEFIHLQMYLRGKESLKL